MRGSLFAGTILVTLLAWPAGSQVSAQGTSYTIKNLGTYQGNVPNVTGMNASGEISGWYSGADGDHAIRYTDANGWSLVPGLESALASYAMGINDHGDIVGYASFDTGMRAFRFVDDGTPAGSTEFIDAMAGGTYTLGLGINNNGDVVGYGVTGSGLRAFRRAPGGMLTTIDAFGGSFTGGCAINDAGQVAGFAATPDGVQHAFRRNADGTVVDVPGLAGPGSMSTSCAMDASGKMSGQAATDAGTTHAFIFADGAPSDIDTFNSAGSVGSSVSGGVVAGSFSQADGTQHAFRYSTDTGSVDLNTLVAAESGWVLTAAKAVNASGAIAGQGQFNGVDAAWVLTPAGTGSPATPADTEAPVIASVSVSPAQLHPDKRMTLVTVSVNATDNIDSEPSCSITEVSSSSGNDADAEITGDLTARVRAALDERGATRTYSLQVTCGDAAQNVSTADVTVEVKGAQRPANVAAKLMAKRIRLARHHWQYRKHHGRGRR
jgi:probable HAF family extracellular repeat protein